MKANELRIGLWFIGYDRMPFQWGLQQFELLSLDVDIDEIIKEPIPLTEEHLIKMGTVIKLFMGTLRFDRFRFSWKDSYKYWYVTDYNTGTYITKIEFVHELQNFFMFVNGQELEVNQ